VPNLPLPKGIGSVNIPRLTTGVEAIPTADLAAQPERSIVDALITSNVVTISGSVSIALQLLEQSGSNGAHLDRVIWDELTSAYDAELEKQLIAGGGAKNELTGLLGLSGKLEITYASATPTASGMFRGLGECFGAVSNARKIAPEVFLLRGGRWASIATGEDLANRPLMPPGWIELEEGSVGSLLGIPAFTSEAIPTNVGGESRDAILAARPSDCYLFDSEPFLGGPFEDVESGSLECRIRLHGYCAFIPKYPTSVAALVGSGMKVEGNF
jgi:HK97 family phage major capsid protein